MRRSDLVVSSFGSSLARWLVFCGVVAFASSASAQNLLLNPDFDIGIGDWSIGSQEFITIDPSASDVDGSPASGSLEMNTAVTGWAAQCVAVIGGEDHRFAGAIAPLSGAPSTIDFSLELLSYTSADCSGAPIAASDELIAPTQLDVWHLLETTVVLPASANSAEFRLRATWTSGQAMARFDALFLPEPGQAAQAVAAALALCWLARYRRAWATVPLDAGIS